MHYSYCLLSLEATCTRSFCCVVAVVDVADVVACLLAILIVGCYSC